MNIAFLQQNPWVLLLIPWELAWKGIALWRAAKLKEKFWFGALLVVNTAGIFPILYLMVKKNEKK